MKFKPTMGQIWNLAIPTLAGLILLLWVGCDLQNTGKNPNYLENLERNGDGYQNWDPSVHYLGRDTCGVCHKLQYDSFTQSEMGHSFKKATRSNSAAQWDHIKPVYDNHLNLYYLPFARGEELFILEFRLEGRDTMHKRLEKIDYIVGSGQHTNSHMREENGYFYQMPLTWYTQKGHWDLPPGFENGANSRFDRKIESECMSCHNGISGYVEGSGNKFTYVPEGIGCERCHGPGEVHVAKMQAGKMVNIAEEIDYSIVNPGKLSADLLMDVCQRCHLQGTAVLSQGKDFYDFRPGQPLNQTVDVFLPRTGDTVQSFIMASQADRMRMSRCFISTQGQKNALTCISCHDPHQPIHQLGQDHYRQSCLNCHQQPDQKMCTKAGPESDCHTCHMPNSGSIDIPHVRITDHNIRIPRAEPNPENDPAKISSYLRLECRTTALPTPLLLARGYLTHYEQFDPLPHFLDSAFANLKRVSDHNTEWKEAWIRALYLRQSFAELAEFAQKQSEDYPDPWTWARIGEAYKETGKLDLAIQNYQKATDLARERIDFRNKLAGLLINQNSLDRALLILNQLIQYAPSNSTAFNNRGFAYVLQNKMDLAEKDFLRALALDPDSETALANLASLYLNTGDKATCLKYARRLVREYPGNAGYVKLVRMAGG
ncbi:MAG: tetratricopeptide repeat protein [Bacteroidia bacterium]|nr:tetratricopeptide repeat protein [Bacteroidia bacterium]